MNKKRITKLPEKTLIVGVKHPRESISQFKESLTEMSLLINTSGGDVVKTIWQEIKSPNPATFFGKGKVAEVEGIVHQLGIELVAVDCELSPVQNRNLEEAWGVRVVDRTAVILDIFALHARSKEGKLQVELAQLEYLAPRLVGRGKMLSQQVGRIGTRGPGETQLEYDRRHLKRRVTAVKEKLAEVKKHRSIHRKRRKEVPVPLVSLVGYTNAGKSTIMNALTKAGLLVEDKLFSTLDPTVRRFKLPSGREILLADTVGFIKKLPHQLVASFMATFEEMAHADLLLEVVDISDPDAISKMNIVTDVLGQLNLNTRPYISVFNKIDLCENIDIGVKGILVSAVTGEGLDRLIESIDETLRAGFRRVLLKLDHEKGEILSALYRVGHVISVKHYGKTVSVDCELSEKYIGKYEDLVVKGG